MFQRLTCTMLATLLACGAAIAAPPTPKKARAVPEAPTALARQNRANRAFYEQFANGPTGTPGVWLELTSSQSAIARYRRSGDLGYETDFSYIRENGELNAYAPSLYRLDESMGTVVQYMDGEARSVMQITDEGAGAFRTETLPALGVSADDAAKSAYRVIFSGDTYEATSASGRVSAFRWVPEIEAKAAQDAIAARQQGLEAKRVAEARQAAANEAQRVAVEQIMAQQRQYAAMNAEQERLDAEADAEFEAERQQRAAQWEQAKAASEQGLAASIARLDGTVASIEAQQAQYRAQQQAAQMAAAGAERQREIENARVATQRQYEEAERFAAQQRAAAQQASQQQAIVSAGQGAAGQDNASRVPASARPLRFVLDVSLLNKPGDTVNPTCYSNIVTRPGPPGWGAPASLPEGSNAQATQAVQSLKAAFIAKCRASGREITGEGDFHWSWNRSQDEEQRLADARARYREDVSVTLD